VIGKPASADAETSGRIKLELFAKGMWVERDMSGINQLIRGDAPHGGSSTHRNVQQPCVVEVLDQGGHDFVGDVIGVDLEFKFLEG
jgi:hypothetical protein